MLEGYITPLLTSYLDKYVRNLKPSDLQLSFWGGDAVLRNLELRVDVLEREMHVPLEFTSGRIRELTLHIPWNAIASSPVEVTIKDLELVVRLKNVRMNSNVPQTESTDASLVQTDTPNVAPVVPSDKEKGADQPGYLQSYLSRISNNIKVHVQNLVVKVMEEECDLMLTLNIGDVEYFTADENWEKKFVYTDYLQGNYAIHKVCKVSDMTVNLHNIEVGGQEGTSHELFLQRCSLSFRMRSEFRGNVFVKKSNHILFESLTFSVDEKQFCLFLQLMDWLMAVYYNNKKLKGRDDQTPPTTGVTETPQKSSKPVPISSPTTPESANGDHVTSPSPDETTETNKSNAAPDQSWGTWMWSFISDVDETAEMSSSSNSRQDKVGGAPGSKQTSAIEPSSTFAVFAKSVEITLKVTHQVQVPLFYSFRHFTTPVLRVSLTGCMAQVDKVSLTKLFLFSMGIASVSASITGLCPCVKRFPSSWRRTSVTAATPSADSSDQILVFSMGTTGKEEEEEDHNIKDVVELMLKRSLFAPPTEVPSTPDSSTIELPPLSDPDLAQLGKHYGAVWFTYQYFDVSAARSIEECTETLRVGHVTASFSPDVVHRLQHFLQALKKSMSANPRFSEGMVVLGDPKAETLFNIEIVGGQAMFTANTHYLSTVSSGSPHTTVKTKKASKKTKKPKSMALPGLCVVSCGLSLNFILPMYSGNATNDVPQRTQLKAKLSDVHAGTVSLQKLGDAQKCAAVSNVDSTNGGGFKQFLHLPSAELNYHTKSHGEDKEEAAAGKRDAVYYQLDVKKIMSSLSHMHISKLLFLGGTWTTKESHASFTDIDCPTHPGSKLGLLHMSLSGTSLSYTGSDYYSLSAAVVAEVSVAMVKDSGSKKLGSLLPVVYGPINTHHWNNVDRYGALSLSHPLTTPTEKLVEVFVARPYENMKDSIFPTFQLNVSGFAICFDLTLLQFVKQLPLEAYTSGADINRTTESIQLPPDPSATPSVAAPSVTADEVLLQDTTKTNFLSRIKGYATKIKIKPVILVFPEHEVTPLLTDSNSVNALPEFPVLPLLSSSPSSSSLYSPSPSAVVFALPNILLQSARSHVLDEPVPREREVDTLPWDCSLADMSLFTVVKGKPCYLVEPLVVKATLAPQQEGSGITVHLDTVALSVSKKQVKLVNAVAHELVAIVTKPQSTLPSQQINIEADDSGVIVSSLRQEERSVPSVMSSPAHSTVTPPTLPAESEVSTVSSSLIFQGFSTLWIQLLISKLVLNIYHRQPSASHWVTSCSKYTTPLTSPGASSKEAHQVSDESSFSSKEALETVKIILEADGISLQVDIQERCTDLIFKMASMEGSYLKMELCQDSTTNFSWLPYLSNSTGKLFSTVSSSLPEELSCITDPLSHPHMPFEGATSLSSPSAVGYLLSPQHQLSPKLQPNFIQVKVKMPQSQPLKTIKFSLNVKPFEVVAWLPVLETVLEVFSVAAAISSQPNEVKPPQPAGGGVATWPSLEVSIECFRVVLPNIDHTHFLLLGVGGVSVTSSIDYVGPDVRCITNSSAFRRISLLSSERKQPPLPAYQLEAISLSMWGVDNASSSLSAVLFGLCSDLRLLYTPPLYWTPHSSLHPGSTTLLAQQMPSKLKPSVLAAGHCLELNFTSDVSLFCGSQQVHCLSDVMSTNFFTKREATDDAHKNGVPTATPAEKGTPLKFLLVGRSVSLSLLTSTSSDDGTPLLSSPQLATPLMLATVYSPVCVMELRGNDAKMEASCFNMAVSYSLDQTSLSYLELAAEPLSLASLMKHQLLETRKGLSQNKSGLPPSLVSASWSKKSEDLESGSKAGVMSLEVGRPVKLSFSLSFFQEALQTLVELRKSAEILFSRKQQSEDKLNGSASGEKTPTEFGTPQTSEFATPQTGGEEEDLSYILSQSEADVRLTELTVTTNQVIVELVLASSDDTDTESERVPSPATNQEADLSLQGEALMQYSKSITKEGLMLAWQSFTFSLPPADKLTQTSELSLDNLQLLSIIKGVPADIVPPVHLNCLITRHKPCSKHDLPQTSLKFSLSLFQVYLSEASMELVRRAIDSIVELLHSASSRSGQPEACDTAEPAVARGGSYNKEGEEQVCFIDDLRTVHFNYILTESTTPPAPQHGDMVFHHGNGAMPPTMTWQYGEPRAVTKLYILPVPFTITTEDDAPVDIKLSCSLEYWSEVDSCYQNLTNFHVSESVHAEWDLPESIFPRSVASRRWRICVNHIEWIDEDMGEVLMESVTSVSGTSVPLSSVLSPVSLAACTKIDTVFSPKFIPLFSVTVHCEQLQLILLHQSENPSNSPTLYEGYQVVTSHQNQEAQELFRISANNGRLFLRQMKEASSLLKVEASLKGEYIDEASLVWRTALYPTKAGLLLEHEGTNLNHVGGPGLSASLYCGPAVFRLSQGLVHTTAMAAHLWKEKTDRASPALLLHSHFILCNDTLDDIHFGQVATGEDILLPSNSCMGYSWKNHKADQQLHACLVADGSWRWTKPFSISQAGIEAIDIPVGRHMASLIVKVNPIGGLQKQVTFLGSWKFFSFVHYPLELQLTLSSQSSDSPHSNVQDQKRRRSFAAAPQLKVLTLQPQDNLPSVVAADSLLEGVKFRMAEAGSEWSKVYPLGNSVHQWSKPHLLAELSSEEEGTLHFWYNIAPLESTSNNFWGNKISFSPLFAITNSLPFELAVTVIDSQTHPSLPAAPSPPHSATSLRESEWLLPGNGAKKPLYSLSADSWYHLQFKVSCSRTVGNSDPSLALSTFLLHHLPVSKEEQDCEDNSGNRSTTKPAIAYLSLPLEDGSYCTVHTALVRNSLNTINALLLTEMKVVNECPWEVELAELVPGEDEKEEALWEGKVLVGERKEKKTMLRPSEKAVCVWREFNLTVRWDGISLTSKTLSFPTLQSGRQKSKSGHNCRSSTTVQMMSTSMEGAQQVVAELSLNFLKCDTTITATLKPSYVIHNSTGSTIHAWPCVLSKQEAPPMNVDPVLALTMEIVNGGTRPVLFWHRLTESSGKGLTPAFRLAVSSSLDVSLSWSIFLSPRFVRHSFTFPTDNPVHSNVSTLLTMHEVDNTTFLVVACDPSPRLIVQNLCPTAMEVVEAGARGIHSSPQLVLPGHEVTYDPPSLAKLYPLVFDSDIASEEEKRLHTNAQKASLCFRVKTTSSQDPRKGWSLGYPLANEQDMVLNIPELGNVLLSMDRYGHSLFVSILPTGATQALQANSLFVASMTKPPKNDLRLTCSLSEVVLCVDDETAGTQTVGQVIRLVTNDAEILYWRSKSKGTKVELSVHSLQVDNMTVQSSAEFSVVLLPRSEHAARPQLVRREPPPLIKALIQFNPRLNDVVDLVHIEIQPVTLQLEDSLLHRLRAILPTFTLPGVLRLDSVPNEASLAAATICVVPAAVLKEAEIDAAPLIISRLVIGPSAVYLTASITLKAFLSCRDSPFRFAEYELTNVSSNMSEVSQVVAARYVSAVFMHLGWLLGSLELIGSPGTFLQSVGSGLRDLISLPYEGLTRSPSLFIIGIGHGAVSFMRQFSTGALTSITNFASSVARNMERLSMDSDHSSYQEQKRKEQPTTHFTSGVSTGVSNFGLSLISAVAGIVDQPMQSFQRIDGSSSTLSATKSVLAGVGKGLIGVVTKPVGGAMELVSHTGQGIMHGTGLRPKLRHRLLDEHSEAFTKPLEKSEFSLTIASCQRKLENSRCLAVVPAVRTTISGSEQSVLVLLTAEKLYLLDCDSNTLQLHFNIEQLKLEMKNGNSQSQMERIEIHLTPHSRSADKDILSPSNFQTVEYYLKLSQMEAQEIPVTAASTDDNDSCTHEDVKHDASSKIVLFVEMKDATRLLSIFHSIRSQILEPELCFCVYNLHATQDD